MIIINPDYFIERQWIMALSPLQTNKGENSDDPQNIDKFGRLLPEIHPDKIIPIA